MPNIFVTFVLECLLRFDNRQTIDLLIHRLEHVNGIQIHNELYLFLRCTTDRIRGRS